MRQPESVGGNRFPGRSLKRFGSLIGGSGFPVDEQGFSQSEMEIPFFKVKDLAAPNKLVTTDNYVSRETAARLGATIFPESTIVFAKVGAALLLNRFRVLGCEACLDNNMMALQLNKPHDVSFFIHLLNDTDLSCNFNQGPVPSVNTRQVGSTIVTVPRPKDQRRIAAYLDASCTAIDAAVVAKSRQLETLNEIHKSALHSTFARFAEEPIERIKDVAIKIGSGVTPEGGAAGYLDSGIPLLRSQNVHFDGLRLDDVACISLETHTEMSNSQIRPRDVLLNITGASIGRCTFVPDGFGEGNVNQHVCIIRPGHRIDYKFLAAFLSSPIGQDQILSTFTGASRQGLSHAELGLIRIPIPPLPIQVQTVERIDRQDRRNGQLRTLIERQIETLTAYRKSLIHECVTGQRRVTEADLKRVGVSF
ncbi:MAG TPA: restriction endonuclease subunit S [Pyrinomonadaceae bacterium]|nr:restriction endonuclease subunit S [Pyrinomonadaceae bacterium]